MAKRDRMVILQSNLPGHPATQAWRELQISHTKPERIEILKRSPKDQRKISKKLVCRLVGVGPGGASVIAKWCKRSSAKVERVIYEEILPQLPIPSLDYYGMIAEENSDFCWLFLEDAGAKLESAQLAEHRMLIAQWLGQMHASSAQMPAASGLPSKSTEHYEERLRLARHAILAHVAGHRLREADLATLESIVRQCDLLEAHWAQVEALCEVMPPTLVHGDFALKNFGMRFNGDGAAILPFDWAEAGWGTPAVDVRKADKSAYLSAVHSQWPWLDAPAIQGLALAGRLFRGIDSIFWERSSLKYLWWSVPMHNMRSYERSIAKAIRKAGFGTQP